MKQNVDLHVVRLQREVPALGAPRLFQIGGAALVTLALVYGYALWRAAQAESHLEALRVQRAAETTRVADLATLYPPTPVDAALEAEVAQLTRERDAKSRLLQLLATHELGNRTGFSEHAAGLARQRVNGLWLRSVHIGEGGDDIALAGSALQPELVPRFLQALGDEAVFAGRAFASLRIERSKDDPAVLDFALRTHAEETP